jgi:Mg2+ and Co2+ transporter CorA
VSKETIEVRWIGAESVTRHELGELPALRSRDGGFVWLDIAEWSEQAERTLREDFGFHPLALASCRERNHTPRVHRYAEHLFLVIHAPLIGTGGHVHYLELDQFIGADFLVTVHGPLAPTVPLDEALRETREVARRTESGRLQPTSPFGLSYAIVSTVARGEAAMVDDLARQVGLLEQRVMAAPDEEPQQFLTQLFTARHELMTIKTMASQGGEIYRRAIKLTTFVPPDGVALLADLLDQYERVARIAQAQLDFVAGVTEFYRARTDTKMTIAAERLAVIAAVTLPITSLSSVLGMNVIVYQHTHWVWLSFLLLVMVVMSAMLLRWAHRQGWW